MKIADLAISPSGLDSPDGADFPGVGDVFFGANGSEDGPDDDGFPGSDSGDVVADDGAKPSSGDGSPGMGSADVSVFGARGEKQRAD